MSFKINQVVNSNHTNHTLQQHYCPKTRVFHYPVSAVTCPSCTQLPKVATLKSEVHYDDQVTYERRCGWVPFRNRQQRELKRTRFDNIRQPAFFLIAHLIYVYIFQRLSYAYYFYSPSLLLAPGSYPHCWRHTEVTCVKAFIPSTLVTSFRLT